MEQHITFEYEGCKLHYRDEGRSHSEVLVLLHGFLQNQDVWSSYTLSFMRDMRVIAIDLPGHGHSDCLGEIHTMPMMAKAVKAVLEHAGVEQCVMIGHSMGGYVALAFAHEYQYMLRGLGLLNSHALPDDNEHIAEREHICTIAQNNKASFILDFIPRLFSPTKEKIFNQDIKDLSDQCLDTSLKSIIAAQRGMAQRESMLDTLNRLEIPTLFIYGKDDVRLPFEIGVSQALEARHAEILLLADVGHMSFIEERDYVKPRLKNFFYTCYY